MRIQIDIDEDLNRRLKIHLINKSGQYQFSQSSFISAAIMEKLDREEEKQ